MSVILILALIVAGVVIWLVPAIAAQAVRAAMSRIEVQRGRSIDQDVVEARLTRIEEAIDAMALQIERLTEQQRALLAPLGGTASGQGQLPAEPGGVAERTSRSREGPVMPAANPANASSGASAQ